MKDFDYTTDARWCVTICTHERKCTLGEIVEGEETQEMRLSEVGEIVEEEWLRTAELRPYVLLDEYVIMPNHFHALLEIIADSPIPENTHDEENALFDRRGVARYAPEFLGSCRGTARRAPTNSNNVENEQLEKFGKPTSHSLPTIIRSFKSAVTKRVNELYKINEPFWQRNYYEHGIRSDKSLEKIREYIKENPLIWNDDEDNPTNLSKRR